MFRGGNERQGGRGGWRRSGRPYMLQGTRMRVTGEGDRVRAAGR